MYALANATAGLRLASGQETFFAGFRSFLAVYLNPPQTRTALMLMLHADGAKGGGGFLHPSYHPGFASTYCTCTDLSDAL